MSKFSGKQYDLSGGLDFWFGAAQGSIVYRDAASWKVLAPGSAGQVLQAAGTGANPAWATPAGGGNVSTSGSPAAGQFAQFTSGTAVQGLTGAQTLAALGLNAAGQVSFRNRLRNGNFAVNQRAVSGTVTLAAGAYGHDGFKAGANGATYTFSTSGADTTVSISAGTLLQIVPGSDVATTAYVASWSGTATARVYQGTATGSYAASPLAASGLTAGTATTVEWSTGTLTLAQFEPGTAASLFERRPLDYEMEKCAFHFQKVPIVGNLWAGDGNSYGTPFTFNAMRTTPTASYVLNSSANIKSGYPTVAAQTANGGTWTIAATSTTGISVAYNAIITLSAEL